MKKFLAAGCCIFFFQSFSQVAPANEMVGQKVSDKRTLAKAIAVMVNTEANKKAPAKKIYVPALESPLF
jgi:hypothetical protein